MSMDITNCMGLQVLDECLDAALTNSNRAVIGMLASQEGVSESAATEDQEQDSSGTNQWIIPEVALELTVVSEEHLNDEADTTSQPQEDVMDTSSVSSNQVQEKSVVQDVEEVQPGTSGNAEKVDCAPGTSTDGEIASTVIPTRKTSRRRSIFADVGIESPPDFLNVERRKSCRVTKQTSIFDESVTVPTKKRGRAKKIEYVFEHDTTPGIHKSAMKRSSVLAGPQKEVNYSPVSTVYIVPHLDGWNNDAIRMPEDTQEPEGVRLSSADLQLTPTSRKRMEDTLDVTDEIYFNMHAIFGDERERHIASTRSFEELFCGRDAIVKSSSGPTPAPTSSSITKADKKPSGRRRSKAASSVAKLTPPTTLTEEIPSIIQPRLQDVENVDPAHSPNSKKLDDIVVILGNI